jgi:surfeit locus 1 family protein
MPHALFTKKYKNMTIKFAKLPTAVFLCLLVLLLSLGTWQANRATEKRAFLQQQTDAQAMEATRLSVTTLDNADSLRYRRLIVSGHYDTQRQFLVDNQISAGKAGYFVLTPFVLQGENKAILVNRGWLVANPDRKQLPDVSMPSELITITGRANRFPSVGIKLEGADIPTASTPSVVQVVNSERISQKLGYPVFSFQLELDSTQPNGFKRDWHTSTLMPPEQHIIYSAQWFGLALTLSVLFIVYSIKKSS